MKTNELIEKVKHLGLETKYDSQGILITNKEGIVLCYINLSQRFQLDMDHYYTDRIEDVIKEELFRIACQYASTPIYERVKVDEPLTTQKELRDRSTRCNYCR